MWLVGNGEQSRGPIQLYNPVGSGWRPGPNGATYLAPSTLDPDLLFSQLAALRALTVKVSFLHIEQCPLRYGIGNMSHSAVYDTIIKGPFHPNDLFPVTKDESPVHEVPLSCITAAPFSKQLR